MVGISGSGKSFYANGLKTSLTVENSFPTELVETDAIRKELFGDANDQSQGSRVFGVAKARVSKFLSEDKNVVIDATSLNRRDRKDWINMGRFRQAEVLAYFINTSVETAKKQNLKRDRQVPDWVIDRQASKLSAPTKDEGLDKVIVV